MERPKLNDIFQRFFSKYGHKRIVILTHNRADTDALASAYAMSKVLPSSVICSEEEMNEGAQMLAHHIGIETKALASLDKKEYEGLVVVDTSAYTLAPGAKGWKILFIVDHHRGDGRDMKGEFEALDPDSPSASEIIADMLEDKDVDQKSAFALSVGIIADAARFKSARANTFDVLARLMKKADAPYSELLSFAEPDPKNEAKIAMLTAMKRVNFIYSAGYIIATSEVGSNESDAAQLISDAADVAFVAKWKDSEQATRISARARKSVKVPLNTVMDKVAQEIGGAGGGHQKAAGASLKAHTAECLKKCVEVFVEMAGG